MARPPLLGKEGKALSLPIGDVGGFPFTAILTVCSEGVKIKVAVRAGTVVYVRALPRIERYVLP